MHTFCLAGSRSSSKKTTTTLKSFRIPQRIDWLRESKSKYLSAGFEFGELILVFLPLQLRRVINLNNRDLCKSDSLMRVNDRRAEMTASGRAGKAGARSDGKTLKFPKKNSLVFLDSLLGSAFFSWY